MSKNFAEVVRNMSYHTENFSHWCQRSQPAEHRTIMNVGLALLLFVGLGYLLGQFPDRRAFLLLACWGISVLPAILSQEPADRRMAMVFPFSHALAGTTLAAFLQLIRERGGRLAEALARHSPPPLGLAVDRPHQPGVAPAPADQPGALQRLSALHPPAARGQRRHLHQPAGPVPHPVGVRQPRPFPRRADLPAVRRAAALAGDGARPAVRLRRSGVQDHRRRGGHRAACARPTTRNASATCSPRSRAARRRSRCCARCIPPPTLERHPVPRAERTLVAMTVDIERHRQAARAVRSSPPPATLRPRSSPTCRCSASRAPTAATARRGGRPCEGGILRRRRRLVSLAARSALPGGARSASTASRVWRRPPQPMLAGVHPFTLQLAERRRLHAAAAHRAGRRRAAPQRGR